MQNVGLKRVCYWSMYISVFLLEVNKCFNCDLSIYVNPEVREHSSLLFSSSDNWWESTMFMSYQKNIFYPCLWH